MANLDFRGASAKPMVAIPPSRSYEIDGKPLRVFDDLLPNVAEYVAALSCAAFTRTEVARPDTSGYRHWATEIRIEALVQQPIYELTQRAVLGFTGSRHGYGPYRAYTNVASYGDMLFTHTDCLPDQHDLTALWYLCESWDLEWGGETMFYDADNEVACAVTPRPGRLVVFDGAIKHAGRQKNRICYTPRYTMAIKFERRIVSI